MHIIIKKLLNFSPYHLEKIALLLKSRSPIQNKIRNILIVNDDEKKISLYLDFMEECRKAGIHKKDIEDAIYLTEEKEIERLLLELTHLMGRDIGKAFEDVVLDELKKQARTSVDDLIPIIEMLLPENTSDIDLLRQKIEALQEIVDLIWGQGEYASYLMHLYVASCAKSESILPSLPDEKLIIYKKAAEKLLSEKRSSTKSE